MGAYSCAYYLPSDENSTGCVRIQNDSPRNFGLAPRAPPARRSLATVPLHERPRDRAEGVESLVREGRQVGWKGPRAGQAGKLGRRVQHARRPPRVAQILEREELLAQCLGFLEFSLRARPVERAREARRQAPGTGRESRQ